jgi:hypothetical protein
MPPGSAISLNANFQIVLEDSRLSLQAASARSMPPSDRRDKRAGNGKENSRFKNRNSKFNWIEF